MEKETRYKDSRIRYREEGSGDTLLLLHGFCESLDIWDEFIKVLSQRYHVIAPDLLGHGKSDAPSPIKGSGEYLATMEMQAEGVNEVLEACRVERCTIVGHSMGGYTALAFAELFPEKVRGLCLFHSTAMADTEEKRLDRDRAIEVVRKDKDAFVEGMIPKMFAPSNAERMKKDRERVLAIAKDNPQNGFIAALAGMRDRKDRQHVLERADYPVLFIIGKDDLLIPLDKMMPQIVKPGHSEVLMLSRVGHMGFYEAKEKTLFAVGRFMEETGSGVVVRFIGRTSSLP